MDGDAGEMFFSKSYKSFIYLTQRTPPLNANKNNDMNRFPELWLTMESYIDFDI